MAWARWGNLIFYWQAAAIVRQLLSILSLARKERILTLSAQNPSTPARLLHPRKVSIKMLTCELTLLSPSLSWTDMIPVEGAEFQCSNTRPDIPYTLYVNDSYLFLVPRQVAKVHPNFPTIQGPLQRFKLELSDHVVDEYRTKYNKEPKFSRRNVGFGLEDDEVVFAALLEGSDMIPHWEFRTLLDGTNPENKHLTDYSSDAGVSFGIMQHDLSMAARR